MKKMIEIISSILVVLILMSAVGMNVAGKESPPPVKKYCNLEITYAHTSAGAQAKAPYGKGADDYKEIDGLITWVSASDSNEYGSASASGETIGSTEVIVHKLDIAHGIMLYAGEYGIVEGSSSRANPWTKTTISFKVNSSYEKVRLIITVNYMGGANVVKWYEAYSECGIDYSDSEGNNFSSSQYAFVPKEAGGGVDGYYYLHRFRYDVPDGTKCSINLSTSAHAGAPDPGLWHGSGLADASISVQVFEYALHCYSD